jgi:hypothetical protein
MRITCLHQCRSRQIIIIINLSGTVNIGCKVGRVSILCWQASNFSSTQVSHFSSCVDRLYNIHLVLKGFPLFIPCRQVSHFHSHLIDFPYSIMCWQVSRLSSRGFPLFAPRRQVSHFPSSVDRLLVFHHVLIGFPLLSCAKSFSLFILCWQVSHFSSRVDRLHNFHSVSTSFPLLILC